MTEKLGKVIHFFGHPLSGKTTIISKITNEIENINSSFIFYERFWNNGGYPSFYKEIEKQKRKFELVIAESANCEFGNNSLCINLFVREIELQRRIEKYRRESPEKIWKSRIGNFTANELKKSILYPKCKYEIFNMEHEENTEKIIQRIINYVNS